MIEVQLYILLIPYAIFIVFFIVFAFINLYHMVNFGFVSFESFLMTFLFIAGAVLILFTTYQLAMEIDWTKPLFLLEQNFFQFKL